MEKREKIIEILLATILVILLIILILLVTNFPTQKKSTNTISTSTTTYYNTYNTYDYNYPKKNYYSSWEKDYKTKYKNYLEYNTYSEHEIKKGILGNDVYRYYVYVKNQDSKSGYFTVKFYFKNYYNEIEIISITKYIKAKEKEKFFYQDINGDKYKYYKWNYKIIPEKN